MHDLRLFLSPHIIQPFLLALTDAVKDWADNQLWVDERDCTSNQITYLFMLQKNSHA